MKTKCANIKKFFMPTLFCLILLLACTDIVIPTINLKIVYILEIGAILVYARNKITPRFIDTRIWMLLWFASFFFSLGHIISIPDFIRIVLGQLLLFALSYLSCEMCLDADNGKIYFSVFAKSALFIAVIGILQITLYYVIGSTWGISHQNSIYGLARPRSFTGEPDWYGLVCGIATIYYFIMYCEDKSKLNNHINNFFATLISILGLAISFTRAAWLSTAFALLVYLIAGKGSAKRKIRIISSVVIIGLVLLLLISVISPEIFSGILKRISIKNGTEVSYDGGAWHSRMLSINIALYYIRQHPITGNGVGGLNYITGTLSILNQFGIERLDMVNNGAGNANIITTSLFETGIIGLLLLITYFTKILCRLFIAYKNTKDVMYIINAVWILFCFIDYQFNNGLRQPYLWILFGFADYLLSIDSQSKAKSDRLKEQLKNACLKFRNHFNMLLNSYI